MNVFSLERRLRKVEIRARGEGSGPWFFVWGRSDDEIAAAAESAPAPFIPITWQRPQPIPTSRWARAADLSDDELAAIVECCTGLKEPYPDAPDDPREVARARALTDDQLVAEIVAGAIQSRETGGVPI